MPQYTVPFGAAAIAQLADVVRDLKAADPLAPVTVAVPSNYAGLSLRRTLGFGQHRLAGLVGEGLVNVRFMVFPRVAEFLGAPQLASQGLRPLTPVVFAELVRHALLENSGPLAGVADHPSTVQSLVRTFRELRRADPQAVAALAQSSVRAKHVGALFAAFRARCTGHYYDEEDLTEAAAMAVDSGAAALRDIGHVVLYLAGEFSPGEQALASALERRSLLTELRGEDGAPNYQQVRLFSAPDPEEEMRTALRLALQAADEGRSLHRMAVLYPAAQPYALLAHAVLGATGIPFNGPASGTLAQSMAGRFLLAALQLAGQDFRRGAVMDWLTSCPIRLGADAAALVPSQRWEVLARQASVVRGRDLWQIRLTALAAGLRDGLQQAEADGRSEAVLAAMTGTITYAAAFQEFLTELFDRLQSPMVPTWQAHADWASGLLDRYLGSPTQLGHWDDSQLRSYEAVRSALEELQSLPDGAVVSDREFIAALTQKLQDPAGRTGRFGEGLFVGRYRDALGADFDTVFLVGMNEGLLPGRGSDDPLLPDAERGDGIPLRSTRLDDERRAYLAALAAAPNRVLLYARADPRGQQARIPSRWLLEAASALEGRLLATEDLEGLQDRDWFSVIPSFEGGLTTQLPLAALQDYDLRSLLQWNNAGRPGQHFLLKEAPRLDRGLQAQYRRRGQPLTPWDGLVSPALPVLSSGRPLSPTSLQTWAECPLHYFFGNVLRLQGTETPEDIISITPLERGTLIHSVLERFMNEAPQRRTPDQPWAPEERALLQQLAESVCDDAEQRGVTGKRLLWELERTQVLRDIEGFLDADEIMRRELGVVPLLGGAELRFGGGTAPASIELRDGRTVAFRGSIDRVDVSPAGDRVVVVDYKTGSAGWYLTLDKTTIDRGRRLQLIIYGLAAAAAHPNAEVQAWYWFVTEREGYRRIGYTVDAPRLEVFSEALDTIVTNIERGVFPAHPGKPSNDSYENCRFCSFDRCCPADRSAVWARKKTDPVLAGYLTLIGDR